MTQQSRIEYPPAGTHNRRLVSMNIPAFSALPNDLVLPSSHFVCLVCSDARSVPDRIVIDAATALLDRGLVYLCAWGPDCDRVRNLFEATALVWNSRLAMLTVHLYEDLNQALEYFLDVAYPVMEYTATCKSGLVLNVGNPDWAEQIHAGLSTACSETAEV